MSMATPSKIRELQIKLYRKAKDEAEFRFYQLYDKVYREDILNHAYELARANDGAPGVDGKSFEDIESAGLTEWRTGLREDLRNKTYQPQPVRRVMIEKPGGGERPLGFRPFGTGWRKPRPSWSWSRSGKRSWIRMLTATGRRRVRRWQFRKSMNCCTKGIRISLTRICRSTSTPSRTPSCCKVSLVDRHMLHLIKMWLKVPVEERDDDGKRRLTGGKDRDRGTPQGGVISPPLANLYMNRMLKGWRQTRREEKLRAQIGTYADGFGILTPGKAKEALD